MQGQNYWFRKKRRGWGYEPGSRKGWIATVMFLLVDCGGIAVLIPMYAARQWWVIVAWCIGWTAAFLALVFAKGEPLW
jgi:hypothetical protein